MNVNSEDWVEIYERGQKSYYWNRRTGEMSHDAVPTSWAGQEDPSCGRFYFWRIGTNSQPVWVLPQLRPASASTTSTAKPVQHAAESEPPCFLEPGTSGQLEPNDCWVKVETGVPYFWNFKLGITMPKPPRGKSFRWVAHRSHNSSRWYYEDVTTGNVYWEVPWRSSAEPSKEFSKATAPPNDRWLEVGAPVCIIGFNNQVGVVIDATSDRCVVGLPEGLTSMVLAVKPDNIRPLPSGSRPRPRSSSTRRGSYATIRTQLLTN